MQTLVFDGRTGASGDMICAALIAAGADPDVLSPVTKHLPVEYDIGETTKNGIRAVTVDVHLTDRASADASPGGASTHATNHDDAHEQSQSHGHGHDHSHGHSHDHGHPNDHNHDHDHPDNHDHDHPDNHDHDHPHNHDHDHPDDHTSAEGSGVHRSYLAVVDLVESLALPDDVESMALDAFERLGRAEATIHGTELTETHFHEVGADDAIADIVGAALLLADLDPERVVTTPVAGGGGTIEMSHGVYPVPAPATTEIVANADFALVGGPLERELLTPTGAAILAAVAEGVDAVPPISIDVSGYGAGDATFVQHPNVLRVLVGDAVESPAAAASTAAVPEESGHHHAADHHDRRLAHDDIAVLETNLDDASPEVLGGLQSTLVQAGARDVTIVPTTMKKSRPGHLVKVICKPTDAAAVAEQLAKETGTLGVRQSGATHRWIAEREFQTATISVDGSTHDVAVKVASTTDGSVYDISAEYDDAAAVAEATGTPIREVLRRAETSVRDRLA